MMAWVFVSFGNVSLGQTPELLLTNILKELDEIQQELQSQTVKATVLVTTNPDEPAPKSQQMLQYDLSVVFFDWGYVAHQVINAKEIPDSIKPGLCLSQWAVRSNSFSQSIDVFANPTSLSKTVKGQDVEVSNRDSKYSPSFVFTPLVPQDIKSNLGLLRDIRVTWTTNSDSRDVLMVNGVSTGEILPADESFQIEFDPKHKMFPVAGSISVRGNVLNRWTSSYLPQNASGYYPNGFATEVFRNGAVVLSRMYTNIIISRVTIEKHDLIEAGRIPKGAIVNEYRFERDFAYVQNDRDPTPEELAAMISSDTAIKKYQALNITVSPMGYASPQAKRRPLVIAFLVVWTIVSVIFLFSRFRRR